MAHMSGLPEHVMTGPYTAHSKFSCTGISYMVARHSQAEID